MTEAALQAVRAAMGSVRVATASNKVYKDECVFSFASALSEGGLYINLQTFQAVGEKFLELDSHRSGCTLYLHKKQREVCCRKREGERRTWQGKWEVQRREGSQACRRLG